MTNLICKLIQIGFFIEQLGLYKKQNGLINKLIKIFKEYMFVAAVKIWPPSLKQKKGGMK